MAFKQTLDTTTQQPILQIYFFNTFCLSEKMKDNCIATIQKQIIMKKYHLMTRVLQNFNANLKTLVEWFWRDLA